MGCRIATFHKNRTAQGWEETDENGRFRGPPKRWKFRGRKILKRAKDAQECQGTLEELFGAAQKPQALDPGGKAPAASLGKKKKTVKPDVVNLGWRRAEGGRLGRITVTL